MPTPPVSDDLSIKSIGTTMTGIPSRLSTWGQVRTSVYMEGPYSGFFDNVRRHYEYIPNMPAGPSQGMTAVESGNRLFRGAPLSCVGSNIIEYGEPYFDEELDQTITPIDHQWFRIGATMDFSDMPLILLNSTWSGAQEIVVESVAYDGTDVNGQEIAPEPDIATTITSIELVF